MEMNNGLAKAAASSSPFVYERNQFVFDKTHENHMHQQMYLKKSWAEIKRKLKTVQREKTKRKEKNVEFYS